MYCTQQKWSSIASGDRSIVITCKYSEDPEIEPEHWCSLQ